MIRYPALVPCRHDIEKAFGILSKCYESKNKLLICGNGGSAADADHIVGELMKSFSRTRILPESIQHNLKNTAPDRGAYLASTLQPALSAISLTCHSALNTAFANDADPQLIFAQQVIGYGTEGDVLLAISTSGNAENVVDAVITAKSIGLATIALSGSSGGKLKEYCDVTILVDGSTTGEIQELHLPVYHTLCEMLENKFFSVQAMENV